MSARLLVLGFALGWLPGVAAACQCTVFAMNGPLGSTGDLGRSVGSWVVDFEAPPEALSSVERVVDRFEVVVHLRIPEPDPVQASVDEALLALARARGIPAVAETQVVRVWKWPGGGAVAPAVLEVSSGGASMCGLALAPGEWLAFAGAPVDGVLRLSSCQPFLRLVAPDPDPFEVAVVSAEQVARLTAVAGAPVVPGSR